MREKFLGFPDRGPGILVDSEVRRHTNKLGMSVLRDILMSGSAAFVSGFKLVLSGKSDGLLLVACTYHVAISLPSRPFARCEYGIDRAPFTWRLCHYEYISESVKLASILGMRSGYRYSGFDDSASVSFVRLVQSSSDVDVTISSENMNTRHGYMK